MGWLWASKQEDQSAANPPPDRDVFTPSPPPPANLPPSVPEPPSSQPEIARHPPLTREALADAELATFLRELQSTSSTTPSPSSSSESESCNSQVNSKSKIDPLSLYPTTMSCRAAFDSAFYCQSLGGQFVSVYRYGNMRSCSDHWSQFWFCMRTNRGFMNEEERKRKVQTWYWDRDAKYRSGASSEDVWRPRVKRVEGAFEGDFEAVERGEGGREGEVQL